MTNETHQELVRYAIRTALHLLAESLSQHGEHLEDWRRDKLRDAIHALDDAIHTKRIRKSAEP